MIKSEIVNSYGQIIFYYIIFILSIVFVSIKLIAFIRSRKRKNNGHQNVVYSKYPCPLHGMTAACMSEIHRDFPNFDYAAYRNKAGSLLQSYFTAVNTKNISFLAEACSAALRNSVQGIIYDLNVRGAAQYYNNSFIHDIQIARYIRDGKTATIVFEISVEYYSYIVG